MGVSSSAPGPSPPPQVVVPGIGWVDVASRAIVQVGFPVVVAAVLLWYLLTRFQDNMTAITTRMAANTEAGRQLLEAQTAQLGELRAQTAELKAQTGLLHDEAKVMEELAADAARLVEMRRRDFPSRAAEEPAR
jgi:cell division protein FtsB